MRTTAQPERVARAVVVRRIALGSAALLAIALTLTGLDLTVDRAMAQAAPTSGVIRVRVPNVRGPEGRVGCSLFDRDDGFPSESSRALRRFWVPIREGGSECIFLNVPPGEYAVGVLHDEDGDGRVSTNFVGYPTEGWGVSNNVGPQMMSGPSFDQARFRFDGRREVLTVRLRY